MNSEKFERNVKVSFALAKQDVENLKNSVSDWILFLDANQRELKERIRALEARIRILEAMGREEVLQ